MPDSKNRDALVIAAIVVSTIGILLFDLWIELGVACGVAYVGVVALAYLMYDRRWTWSIAIVCSILVVTGYFLSPAGGELWKIVTNRGLALFVIATTATFCDLSIRAQLKWQQRATQEQQLMSTLVESVPDAIYFKDLESRFIRANFGTAKIFGVRDPKNLIGKTDADFFTPEEAFEYLADEKQIIETGEPLINKEERETWLDDQVHWVLTTKMPLRDASGEIVGTFGISRDITDLKENQEQLELEVMWRKRTEQELEQRHAELAQINDELQRSNEELDNFAYVASHDLRTPLRNIESLVVWLVEDAGDALPETCKEHIRLLRGRVASMDQLLNDLLQYSRVGRKESEPEPVDIKNIIEEVKDLLEPPTGFKIEIQNTMPTLHTPRTAIRKVFQNLIGNAIEHSAREDGHVEISYHDKNGLGEFVVKDNGPGIEPRFHERVFKMFQTLAPRDGASGSGMGLAIVKKTVESFGGTVELDSAPGEGATFRFTWNKQIN